MRRLLLLSASILSLTSAAAFAEGAKATQGQAQVASGYSSLLPTEQDLAKSTAASEAKAKADKEKLQRTGMPRIPKSKSKLALTATCKDAAGKSYAPNDLGYDSCISQATTEAQLKRSTDSSASTGTGTGSSSGAGFNVKIGD